MERYWKPLQARPQPVSSFDFSRTVANSAAAIIKQPLLHQWVNPPDQPRSLLTCSYVLLYPSSESLGQKSCPERPTPEASA